MPVVLDPVLANGGATSSRDDAARVIEPVALATVITPNLNEARRLCGDVAGAAGGLLMQRGCAHVLLKGGHGPQEQDVINRWYGQLFRSEFAEEAIESARWRWTRLPDEFHGSGCTLRRRCRPAWRAACPCASHRPGPAPPSMPVHVLRHRCGQRIPNRVAQPVVDAAAAGA
jgi:hydroxymethylpyrimidine/phosphomethylpyrimidine kinase